MKLSDRPLTRRITGLLRETAERYKMFEGVASLLAALSGGSDSVTLLRLLRDECAERGITLYAAHVNHMIRGEEADRDERFCRCLCEELGVELFVLREDVPAIAAERRVPLEEAARDVRYGFFAKVCAERSIDRVATAHNARDNAETVLFNLARGTGTRGLRGIPPVRDAVIRPLIACEKELILGYCRENDWDFVTDSTNADTDYTRNYIRHELLPRFERLNPAFCQAAARMCEAVRGDSAYLDGEAAKVPSDASAAVLASLPDPLLSRVVARLYAEYGGRAMLCRSHIDAAVRLIRSFSGYEKRISMPGLTLALTVDGLGPTSETAEGPMDDVLLPDGTFISPDGRTAVYTAAGERSEQSEKDINELKNIYKLFIQTAIISVKISGSVFIGSRKPGDRIFLRGMHKSVKKLFCDLKLPRGTPVLRDGGGVLFIPGVGARDGASASPKTPESETVRFYFFGGGRQTDNFDKREMS